MSSEVNGLLMALGAGLCTTIGGACVFFVKDLKRLPLAICMAVSAGVMCYVSLIEIFPESQRSIEEGLIDRLSHKLSIEKIQSYAYLCTTLCFFGGWFVATLVDVLVEKFIEKLNLESRSDEVDPDTHEIPHGALVELENIRSDGCGEGKGRSEIKDSLQIETQRIQPLKLTSETAGTSREEDIPAPVETVVKKKKANWCWRHCVEDSDSPSSSPSRAWDLNYAELCFRRDNRRFLRTGVFTAIALTIHNLPEGVATFTGAMASSKLGLSLSVAIGVHNIPEGFAVSVPLYFGTRNKWQSFFYSVITGLAEPIGALLAWSILGGSHDRLSLGIAFGFVCGIMTNIALIELLPAAFKYDPCDQVTSKSFVVGMFVMATSLVLFNFN